MAARIAVTFDRRRPRHTRTRGRVCCCKPRRPFRTRSEALRASYPPSSWEAHKASAPAYTPNSKSSEMLLRHDERFTSTAVLLYVGLIKRRKGSRREIGKQILDQGTVCFSLRQPQRNAISTKAKLSAIPLPSFPPSSLSTGVSWMRGRWSHAINASNNLIHPSRARSSLPIIHAAGRNPP